jgi:hypothetical protein
MPKATLEYNLDLPEDLQEFELANNARKYSLVLWELDQYLRNFVKYPSDREDPIHTDTMAKVRDELWRLLNEHNLDLNS